MSTRVLFPALALALLACSSSSSSSSSADPSSSDAVTVSTEPPPGCERTLCDSGFDNCEEKRMEACHRCDDACSVVLDFAGSLSCRSGCDEICDKAQSKTYCEDERARCTKTGTNTVCIDGVDPRDLPKYPAWSRPLKPPAPPHKGACTDEQLDVFVECLGPDGASDLDCAYFAKDYPKCYACLVTDVEKPVWGPVVSDGDLWMNNLAGCYEAVAGNPDCAYMIDSAISCLSKCHEANDVAACRDLVAADPQSCGPRLVRAEACVDELRAADPAAFAVCGTVSVLRPFRDEDLRPMFGFFCGK